MLSSNLSSEQDGLSDKMGLSPVDYIPADRADLRETKKSYANNGPFLIKGPALLFDFLTFDCLTFRLSDIQTFRQIINR